MERYDIYWANVPFDTGGEKIRPAVVIADVGELVKFLKITSQGTYSGYQMKIEEWQKAGLEKESYIVFEPFYDIGIEKIGDKVGRLQLSDITRLERYLLYGERP